MDSRHNYWNEELLQETNQAVLYTHLTRIVAWQQQYDPSSHSRTRQY